MPDFGAILRKAREGAVLTGAAGATGAGSKLLRQNRGAERLESGPGSSAHPGPPGPQPETGPGGPALDLSPGPALLSNWRDIKQPLSAAGPAGPGGPIEKQGVCESGGSSTFRRVTLSCSGADPLQRWRDGLGRLDCSAPPCPGFRTWEWEEIERVVRHFMHHCADEAAARGWTALDLFGVHRTAGAAAVDSCGALMLPGTSVATRVSADAITFGRVVYRKRPMPEAVLVWEFVGADQRTGDSA